MMKKPQNMTIEEIPCYRFITREPVSDTVTEQRSERLDFIPVKDVPGFSHRVAYNGVLTPKYLGSNWRISQKVALDMLDIVRTWKREQGQAA